MFTMEDYARLEKEEVYKKILRMQSDLDFIRQSIDDDGLKIIENIWEELRTLQTINERKKDE